METFPLFSSQKDIWLWAIFLKCYIDYKLLIEELIDLTYTYVYMYSYPVVATHL